MQQFDVAQKLCPFKVFPVEEQVMTYLPAFTTINISARMELPLRCI
jgi:hypothetical protein